MREGRKREKEEKREKGMGSEMEREVEHKKTEVKMPAEIGPEELQAFEEQMTVKASWKCLDLSWMFLTLGIITILLCFSSDSFWELAFAFCLGIAFLLFSLYLFRTFPHIRLELSEDYCCYTDFLGRIHEFWMEDVYLLEKNFYRGAAFWVLKDIHGKEIIRFGAKDLENINEAVTFIRRHMNK